MHGYLKSATVVNESRSLCIFMNDSRSENERRLSLSLNDLLDFPFRFPEQFSNEAFECAPNSMNFFLGKAQGSFFRRKMLRSPFAFYNDMKMCRRPSSSVCKEVGRRKAGRRKAFLLPQKDFGLARPQNKQISSSDKLQHNRKCKLESLEQIRKKLTGKKR